MMDILADISGWLGAFEAATWAAVIALCALAATIIVACQNRHHNRLSVTPNVDFIRDPTSNPATLVIKNTGIGPAIISDLAIGMADESYSFCSRDEIGEFKKRSSQNVDVYFGGGKGIYLLPGDSIELLKLKPIDRAKAEIFLGELSATVKWESLYGKKFEYTMDKTVRELRDKIASEVWNEQDTTQPDG